MGAGLQLRAIDNALSKVKQVVIKNNLQGKAVLNVSLSMLQINGLNGCVLMGF